MVNACRACVGLLLLSGGAFKAVGFDGFRLAVQAYRIVGSGVWSTIVAGIVVCCECILGAALAVGWLPRLSSGMALVMLGVFSTAAATVVLRGHAAEVRCGCKMFAKDDRIGWQLGLRNMALGCLLLPSAQPMSNIYGVPIMSSGVLFMILSVAAADPRRFQLRIARMRRVSQ